MTDPTELDLADAIGRQITASAVWHGDRCNWVGAMPEAGPGGRSVLCYQALGPDLYAGTAGVGLFLAELAAVTADPAARRTAGGALRHAASHVNGLLPAARAGLYSGHPGVTLALALAARALDDDELEHRAQALADDLTAPAATDEADLMSGHAGAIVGLLCLRWLLGREELLAPAEAHAEGLVATAQRTARTACWRSPSLDASPGLAGLSHGAAGVALALLELAAVTGSPEYRETAAAALRYERGLFDPATGNWPDLRTVNAADGSADGAGFCHFWCHGAPGGALARLRAAELTAESTAELTVEPLDGQALNDEARAALVSTATWVRGTLDTGVGNYSLCHGLAGNAEILLEGEELYPDGAELARETAQAGAQRHGPGGLPWPSGADGGSTPGLFLGCAGTGRFYLRLAAPELPSLLAVRPRPVAVTPSMTT